MSTKCFCGLEFEKGPKSAHSRTCEAYKTAVDLIKEEIKAGKKNEEIAKSMGFRADYVSKIRCKMGLGNPDYGNRNRNRNRNSKPVTIVPGITAKTITFEQILTAIPDTSVLGSLIVDSFVARIKKAESAAETIADLKSQISDLKFRVEELVTDRSKLIQEVNEYRARKKLPNIGIDEVRKIFIVKEKA